MIDSLDPHFPGPPKSREQAPPFYRSTQKVISICTMLISEAFSLTYFSLLAPFGYLFSPSQQGERDLQQRPILLIHGYLHNYTGWTYIRSRLQKAGVGPVYRLNLGPPFQDIHDYAKKLKSTLEEIEQAHPNHPPILIGHSMGGVVACTYNTYHADPGKACDTITLGSPLQGTYTAKVGLGQCTRQMERGSTFIQELFDRVKKNAQQVSYFHLASEVDQLIIPQTSGFTGVNPNRECALESAGHTGLLLSGRVATQMVFWIKELEKTPHGPSLQS